MARAILCGSEDVSQLLVRTRLGYQSQRLEVRFETYNGLDYEMGDPVQIDSNLYDVPYHEKDLASQDDTIEAVRIRYDDSDITFTEANEDIGSYVPDGGGSTSIIQSPTDDSVITTKGDLIMGDGEGDPVRFGSGEDDGKVIVTDGEADTGWALTDLTPITTKGDFVVGDGEGEPERLPVPDDGHFWVADSSKSLGWRAVSLSSLAAQSEIVEDYYGDADVQRWLVTAEASELSGTGTKTARYWFLTHDQLPDEIIDSDESTAEASGAPTLRMSTDILGINQIPIHVLDFTPAAGGVGGGATAEINLNVGEADHTNGQTVYLWWGKSGKTQPAASATYGSDAVYASDHGANWTNEDFTDSTENDNDGSGTGVALTTNVPFGSLRAYEFGGSGSGDRISVPSDASLNAGTAVTVYGMFYTDGDTGTFQGLIARRNGATSEQYGLAFILGGTDRMDWNYYSGGFKGVGATFSTYFSTGQWEFVAGTLEEVGSGVEVKLYNDSGLIASTTVTSSSLPSSSDVVQLGNLNQSSWGFPLGGEMKAWNVLSDIALDADDIQTLANLFTDPATFWDTTASVVSGPF